MVNNTFNVSNLLHENFDTTRTIYESSIEETYLFSTLKFVTEMKREYRDASKELYVSLLESSNEVQIVNESFSGFFEKVKNIIDKFIKFIKTLISKFLVSLNSAVKSEKFINKHKGELTKFSDKHEFDMDLYTFTNLTDPNIPKPNALTSFRKEYDEIGALLEGLANQTDANRIEKITSIYNDFVNSLQNDWYDNFRGEVIGKNENISSGDFAADLFALFRDNSSDMIDETIDTNKVLQVLARFEGFKNLEKSVNTTKAQIEKDYEAIKKQMSKMIYKNKENKIDLKFDSNTSLPYDYTVGADVISKLDLFVKAKADQVSQMSQIHAIALSAKLDAIGACFKQDKTILYKALYKIQGVVREEDKK